MAPTPGATSYYSSVRMFGALSNVGLGDLAIPSEVWTPELIRDAAGECVRNRDDIRAHLRKVVAQARSQSERWWNAIANTALRGRAWEPVESIEAAAPYAFTGSWVAHPRIARPVADHHLRERVIEKRAYSAELKRLQGIVERSRKGVTAAAVELGLVVTPTPPAEGAPSSSN